MMPNFWKEAAILDAFVKKERRVHRGTPYFKKLDEVGINTVLSVKDVFR